MSNRCSRVYFMINLLLNPKSIKTKYENSLFEL
nr:MAG TPA: hypothetical protein [Caudoviricetes sp.]